MAVKDFLAKLFLGSDIHEDLAASKREMHDNQDKYISARNANETLENEYSSLGKSVNLLTHEVNTLKDEQKSLDDYLNQFLNNDERNDAKVVLTKRLKEKSEQLFIIQIQLQSSEKERGRQMELVEGLKGEKASLEKKVVGLKNEVIALKVKSEQMGDKNIIEKKLYQRKIISAKLATLKNEWQKALDIFKERLMLAETDKQDLLALRREIEDYERRVKNSIEIPAE